MSATNDLLKLDPTKSIIPFGDGTNHRFSHSDLQHIQDPTGIANEEGEFLYGLIRVTRPTVCIETGCNVGVSASYIGLALRDNNHGKLTTIEHLPYVASIASDKLARMGLDRVTVFNGEVSDFSVDGPIDFMWLDTEMNQRFPELLRFYPQLSEGALVCIHDIWELDFHEFGGIPEEMKHLLRTGALRVITFHTMHGVTVFQKRRVHDAASDLFK